ERDPSSHQSDRFVRASSLEHSPRKPQACAALFASLPVDLPVDCTLNRHTESLLAMSAPSALRTPWLPKLVVAPSFVLALFFIYGLIAWNGYLSLSVSRLLPNYEFAGLAQYEILFGNERFHVALKNMAIFGFLFIGGAMALGLLLAIL